MRVRGFISQADITAMLQHNGLTESEIVISHPKPEPKLEIRPNRMRVIHTEESVREMLEHAEIRGRLGYAWLETIGKDVLHAYYELKEKSNDEPLSNEVWSELARKFGKQKKGIT